MKFNRNLLIVSCLAMTTTILLSGCSGGTETTPTMSSSISNPMTTTIRPITPVSTTTSIPVSDNGEVFVVASAQNIKPGETFDVVVKVSSEVPSRGMQCTLKWDPSKVECSSAEIGSFYQNFVKENGGDIILLPNPLKADNTIGQFPAGVDKINNTSNRAAIAIAGAINADGTLLGPTGSGDSFILHMIAKTGASGVVDFNLSNVLLKDNAKPSNDIQLEINDAKITITAN